MSGRRRRGKGGKKGNQGNQGNQGNDKLRPVDLWKAVPAPEAPEPIRPSADPTALLRSLGNPPLTGQGAQAVLDLATVVQRSSALATALAAAGGLLDEDDDEA